LCAAGRGSGRDRGRDKDFVLVLLAAVLFGDAYNAVVATKGIWSAEVFSSRPSAGLAAVNTALTIGTIAGPISAGLVIDRAGYPTALLVAGGVTALAVFFCPPSARRRTRLGAHDRRCRATPVRD